MVVMMDLLISITDVNQAAERLVNSKPLPAPPPVAVHEPQPAPAAAGPAAETGQSPAPAGIAGPTDMETGA